MSIPTGTARLDAQMEAEQAFDPEATHAMAVALVGARWILGAGSRSGESAIRLAQGIVEIATRGERDPWRLRAEAVRRQLGTCSAMNAAAAAV